MSLRKYFEEQSKLTHERKLEIISADAKRKVPETDSTSLILFGLIIVLAVLIYGLYVAPCSASMEGKFVGNFQIDQNASPEMNRVFSQDFKLTSFEGKISGQAPCLVYVLRMARR